MDPGTLLVMSAVGTAISAVGSISSGIAQKNAADYNAALSERDAKQAELAAAVDAANQRREGARMIAAQRAGFAASGVKLTGSALEVLSTSAETAELDALNIEYAGKEKATASRADAAASRFQGQAAETAGYFGAAATALGGGARAGTTYLRLKKNTGGG